MMGRPGAGPSILSMRRRDREHYQARAVLLWAASVSTDQTHGVCGALWVRVLCTEAMEEEKEVSEEQAGIDNLTSPRAHKRLGGALTPQERAEAQSRFLEAYKQSGNVRYSCEMAGISRETFYQWKKRNKTFEQTLNDAEPEVDDVVEWAAFEEGVIGIEEPVVSMGKPVYDSVPMLDEEGNPCIDSKGRPMMQQGKMLTIRRRNPTVLITLLKARMPQKYRESSAASAVTVSGQVGFYPVQLPQKEDSPASTIELPRKDGEEATAECHN